MSMPAPIAQCSLWFRSLVKRRHARRSLRTQQRTPGAFSSDSQTPAACASSVNRSNRDVADFQTQVNIQPAPAVAGDFASANPRASVLAGPGALVAGSSGLTVGLFAWIDSTNSQSIANNFGTGPVAGFVHRGSNTALITTFLAKSSNFVPA